MPIKFDDLPNNAKEVMGQLFLNGPHWDGYIVSKQGRDFLYEHGLIERANGWQWLTQAGVEMASDYKSIPKTWFDGRWRAKAIT